MSAVAVAANRFATDLHAVLKNQRELSGENLFYSPTSLSIAMAMVYSGARGSTAEEISKGFHWGEMQPEQVNEEMKSFNDDLNSANTASNQLNTANRLYLQEGFQVLKEFTDSCKNFYGAETALVDYKKDFEAARLLINTWVEEKTNEKIKDLLPSGSLNSLTRATLVNAIYFKGIWEKQFKKEHTFDSTFFISQNQELQTKMMFQKSKFKFAKDKNLDCQMLEIPYAGGDLSMVVILPNDIEGLSKLEEKLSYDALQTAVTSVTKAHPLEVELSMPKFSMTRQFELKDILRLLGMEEMFDAVKADFTGINTGPEKLYVSKVIHKAFVDVNEEGTEAAAATAVVMMTRMMVRPVPSFIVDHPFLFLIRHCKSEAILFLGRVVKPESSK
jgi:serpin B